MTCRLWSNVLDKRRESVLTSPTISFEMYKGVWNVPRSHKQQYFGTQLKHILSDVEERPQPFASGTKQITLPYPHLSIPLSILRESNIHHFKGVSMSTTTIPLDFFLLMIENTREEKQRDRERYCRLGDVPQIHMALGGEDTCRSLLRQLTSYADRATRLQTEHQDSRRRRVLRDRQRQLAGQSGAA